ncbi:hypothetical protein [Novipirellula caenicola]|uniref:Uncharacterized protein n=1 Tax=Novipirellula caenicola TaxID=1536901 RepID=A0ABP9VJU4_9BACT
MKRHPVVHRYVSLYHAENEMRPSPYKPPNALEAEGAQHGRSAHRLPVAITLAFVTICGAAMSVTFTIDPIIVMLIAMGWVWVGWPVLKRLARKA